MKNIVFAILLTVIGAQGWSAPVTVTSRITKGFGDVEDYNGTLYPSDLFIYMAQSGVLGCSNGFYFEGISIPKNSTITNAYITFKCDGANATSLVDKMRIYAEAVDSSIIFSTHANFIARTKTIANVLWTPTAWTIGTTYNTIDISPLIQEVLNRPGYKSGNPITFLFFSEGTSVVASDRRAASFEGAPVNAALLTVTYDNNTFPLPITLTWTAKGDDGNSGTAAVYDIRYATDSATLISWTNATQIIGEPTPKVAGSAESFSFSINAEQNKKYFFAIKVGDEIPNWSMLSNIVYKTLIDTIPPATVTDFRL